MLRQHGAHSGPQQRREMPGQRRDDHHAGLHLIDLFLEVQKRAERRDVGRFFGDGDFLIADGDAVDAVARPGMRQSRAGD